MDGWEWDSLYKNPEDRNSPHSIRLGSAIEAQLSLWPKLILRFWNKRSTRNELAYIGFDPEAPVPERGLFQLKESSNLYLVSASARKIEKRSWKDNPKNQRIDTLLDCGVPVVLSEEVGRGEASAYYENEGDSIVVICLLFASIAYSRALFRAPIIGTVRRTLPLRIVPPATLLDLELQPHLVIPETRVSYHAEPLEVPDIYQSDIAPKVERLDTGSQRQKN